MARNYTKVEMIREEVFRRKAAGETNRETGGECGPTKEQVKGLANRRRQTLARGTRMERKDSRKLSMTRLAGRFIVTPFG